MRPILEETARERIAEIRRLTTDVDKRRARAVKACATCRAVGESEVSSSKGDDQNSLSGGAYDFIPKHLLRRDRCEEYVRCRKCETAYLYKRSYEFLVGGSEDNEDLWRLAFAPLLKQLEICIRFRNRFDAEIVVDRLHDALIFEDITAAAAELRTEIRARIAALRDALSAETAAKSPLRRGEQITELARLTNASDRARAKTARQCKFCRDIGDANDTLTPAIEAVIAYPRYRDEVVRCPRCATHYLYVKRSTWSRQVETTTMSFTRLLFAPALARLRTAFDTPTSASTAGFTDVVAFLDTVLDFATL